jgi:hypothetical protein
MNLNRIITFVIFLSLLFLSACSPATAPTETAPTSAAATDTVASAPTDTEVPAATPTLSAQLEIVESVPWIDQLGDHRVEVLAHNPFDYPVRITFSQAILHDSSGGTLATADFYLGDGLISGGLGVILPDETFPASACFTCMGDNEEIFQGLDETWADTLTVVLKVEQVDPVAYSTEFDVEAGTLSNDVYDAYSLNGTVTYNGEEPLRSAFVRILVYDRNGSYIGWGEANINVFNNNNEMVNIEPGTSHPFSAYVSFPVSEGPLEYEITVIGRVAEEN